MSKKRKTTTHKAPRQVYTREDVANALGVRRYQVCRARGGTHQRCYDCAVRLKKKALGVGSSFPAIADGHW